MRITPQDDDTLVCDPYPFDENNLVVPVVVTEIKNFKTNEISLMDITKSPKKLLVLFFRNPSKKNNIAYVEDIFLYKDCMAKLCA